MVYQGISKMMRESEEHACDIVDGFRENLKESKYGLLKLIAYDTIPLSVGAACGGLSRAFGFPEGIAILPVGALMTNFGPSESSRAATKNLLNWTGYFIGAALPYIDVIFQAVADKL